MPEKKKKGLKAFAACAVCLAIAAAAMGAALPGEADPARPERQEDARVSVNAQTPHTGSVEVTGEYIGSVEPDRQVMVFPKAAGEVLAAHFNVGDAVREGDVLCEIDSRALRASISQMEAALASAQAKAQQGLAVARYNLEISQFNQQNNYDADLLRAQAAVESAEASLQGANISLSNARRNLREFNKEYRGSDSLFEDYDDMPYELRSAYQQLRAAVAGCETQVEACQIALAAAQSTLKATEIAKQEALSLSGTQVTAAELNTNFSDQYIALQKLRDDLEYYAVKSPIGGVVEQKNVEVFGMASMQSPVYVVSNKELMTVAFKVSEDVLAYIKPGDRVTVDKNGRICDGEVTEISAMADAASGLFTVKAGVENAPFELNTGTRIKIRATSQKSDNAMLVPIDALYYENGRPFVYRAADGFARKAYVETGIFDSENIEILSGLEASDLVITTWSARLGDGAEIALPGEGS